MNTIHPTADVEANLAPADNGRNSTAAPVPPQIDRDTYRATRGIAAGVLFGAGLWAVILAMAWLIFG